MCLSKGIDLATLFQWIEYHKKNSRERTICSIHTAHLEEAKALCAEHGVQCTEHKASVHSDAGKTVLVISNLY